MSQQPQPSFCKHSMAPLSPPSEKTINTNNSSTVDTSHPFRSVKEAVGIFNERFVAGKIYSQKAYTSPRREVMQEPVMQLPPSTSSLTNPNQARDDELAVANTLKKLEADLEETKRELKLLKEKESETEIVLASLNAEIHKNMSKMAQAEAAAAAAAKAVTIRGQVVRENKEDDIIEEEDEERRKDPMVRMESPLSLAKILNLGKNEGYYYGITKKQKKKMKKKPIIPLVGDILFSRKKGSSTTLHNPLYSSSIR